MGGINGQMASDRLLVEWNLVAERVSGADAVEVSVPPITTEEIAAASPAAIHARVTLRDSLVPLFADGWCATGVDRASRTYTLTR